MTEEPAMDNRGDNPYARKSSNSQQLAKRRADAMKLRLEGKTWPKIAEELGVSGKTARDDVAKIMADYMREHEAETIPRFRAVELQRIDRMLVEAHKILEARSGTELALKAIDRVLRAVNLRAELLGLKTPVEVSMRVVEQTQADLELQEIVNAAKVQQAQIREQIIAEAENGGPAQVA